MWFCPISQQLHQHCLMGSGVFYTKNCHLSSVCGAARVKAAWSKEPSPEEDSQVLGFAAKLLFGNLSQDTSPVLAQTLSCGPGTLQVQLPVLEPGTPRCCCIPGEYKHRESSLGRFQDCLIWAQFEASSS